MKRLIAFDLDGTLAPSKQSIDAEMGGLLARLMKLASVAIISGGDWPEFEKQLVARLPDDSDLAHLILLPTSGTKLYQHSDQWRCIRADVLSPPERARITGALDRVMTAQSLAGAPSWRPRIEDRGSQITFSALGQQAPLEAKLAFDADLVKRRAMQGALVPLLEGFSVWIGGATSIDITRAGVDKGTGIRKLADEAALPLSAILYIGDAFYPGGNDQTVRDIGVDCVAVRDVEESKRVIETILFCGS